MYSVNEVVENESYIVKKKSKEYVWFKGLVFLVDGGKLRLETTIAPSDIKNEIMKYQATKIYNNYKNE